MNKVAYGVPPQEDIYFRLSGDIFVWDEMAQNRLLDSIITSCLNF